MASYSDNREQNYEIKYLRKVLGQVDKRIRVPQSIDGDSLRALLDNVEPATPRDLTHRRPRWLSLQSGIAYAAAFALIVALFYSMEIYKPDMIDGVMGISNSKPITLASQEASMPSEEAASALIDTAAPAAQEIQQDAAAAQDNAEVAAGAEIVLAAQDDPAPVNELGVGGVESTLLLEQQGHSYYWRANDKNDPDKVGFPVTVDVLNAENNQIVTQINISDMQRVERCFVSDGKILLIGTFDDVVTLRVYDADPANPAERFAIAQLGAYVDAKLYNDIIYIASLSDIGDDDAVELPNSVSDDSCVITSVDLTDMQSNRQSFAGAHGGSVQLHNTSAYIHYDGVNEEDEPQDYIAQILFDGVDIALGSVK